MKNRYKLLLAVLVAFAQVFAPSLAGRAGGVASLFAQDAFYIYRNDGNFDGFFFDEIVRMGYSKVGLDSLEYDVFVVQEIETADSLYRIPLAAIDSIGFQQPEIRLNPRFKNMDELGITPYITQTSGWSSARLGLSKSIPTHLLPQIGDVMATWDPSIHGGKGWVYKITGKSEPAPWLDEDDNSYYYNVESIESVNDVFDQYITVEDIGVDEANRVVRRRIAGCNPDGTIRKAKDRGGEVNLIDLSGTFTNEWHPGENSKIALSADVGVKLRLRVAYNIGWSRLFVKLSRDLIVKAEPSVSMSVSKGFEYSLADIYGLPGITFPATCPIFETNPVPELFVRGEGSMEAALKFPAVELGFGEDIILDNRKTFPVSYDMHMIPSEKKSEQDIIDTRNASVSFSGYLQAGVKFTANLSTASWFRKVLWGDISLSLYCGPKASGEVKISPSYTPVDWDGLNYDPFYNLTTCQLTLALLSFDLEAKAQAAVLWGEPETKTFFSKNWSFLCDTLRLLPVFENPEIKIEGGTVTATLRTKPYKTLGYTVISAGVVEKGTDKIIKHFGNLVYSHSRQEYVITFPLDELHNLKAKKNYCICPVIAWAGREPHAVSGRSQEFHVPEWVEVENTSFEFAASDNLEQTVRIRTNKVLDEDNDFRDHVNNPNGVENPHRAFDYKVHAVDAENGIYDITFRVEPNTDMFYRELTEKDGKMGDVYDNRTMQWVTRFIHSCPHILVNKKYDIWPEAYHDQTYTFPAEVDTIFFTFRQAGSDNPITNRQVKFSASDFWNEVGSKLRVGRGSYSLTFYQFGDYSQKAKESTTMAREGNDRVVVTCKTYENSSSTYKAGGNNYTRTYHEDGTMSFVIARSADSSWNTILHDIVEGQCHSTYASTDSNPKSQPVRGNVTSNYTFSAKHDEQQELTSASTTYSRTYSDGSSASSTHSLTSDSKKAFTLSY